MTLRRLGPEIRDPCEELGERRSQKEVERGSEGDEVCQKRVHHGGGGRKGKRSVVDLARRRARREEEQGFGGFE